MLEKYIKNHNLVVVMILCLASYFAAYDSPANNYGSDPNGSLLVSQAILEHGTIKLDQYSEVFPSYTYQIIEINSHYYYYFPLGTPILSIPFVWMANLIGWDMGEPTNASQAQLQNLISAIAVAISCLLSFLISTCFVNYSRSDGSSMQASCADIGYSPRWARETSARLNTYRAAIRIFI